MKVVKWYRDGNNIIKLDNLIELTCSSTVYRTLLDNDNKMAEVINDGSTITKTVYDLTDTPQELIQVGDLVFGRVDKMCLLVDEVDAQRYYDVLRGWGTKVLITKILTPNSNGGYDLQWEAE